MLGLTKGFCTDKGMTLPSCARVRHSMPFVSFIKPGIDSELLEPGMLQQRRGHGRTHRTPTRLAAAPSGAAEGGQQRFDRFRQWAIDERPNEALERTSLLVVHRPSGRLLSVGIEPCVDPEQDLMPRVYRDRSCRAPGETSIVSQT